MKASYSIGDTVLVAGTRSNAGRGRAMGEVIRVREEAGRFKYDVRAGVEMMGQCDLLGCTASDLERAA